MELLLIAVIFYIVALVLSFLLPNRTNRRFRTAREDRLHDQVQKAMNWTPGQPSLCKDGKWRDSEGNVYVSITLDQMLKKYNIEDKE